MDHNYLVLLTQFCYCLSLSTFFLNLIYEFSTLRKLCIFYISDQAEINTLKYGSINV